MRHCPSTSAALPAGSCGGEATDPPTQLLPGLSAFYPAWAPDCRHIAYSSSGAIWVANIDGSEPRRLVGDANGSSCGAAWSPDGRKIAYAFEQHGDGNWLASIWVINIDGSGKKQLTDGTFHGRGVSWSPDGSTIAFRRLYDDSAPGEHGDHGNYIMMMDASGKNLTQITARNSGGFSPVWSPDGSKIAYASGGNIIEINPDGTDPRWIASGTDSSISWSLHGDRIAYIQRLDDTSMLKTVRTDGFSEQIVAEIPAQAHSPDWSPDGDRLAYYTSDPDHADYRLWITGSAGDAPAAAADCRPGGLDHVSAGFPVPEWSPSAVGTVRLAVLFVDFPNAQAQHSTHAEVAESIPYMEEYLEDASGGKLDLRFSVLHEWLRAEQTFEACLEGGWLGTNASQYSAELAEGKLDFSDIDAVMTIFPSDQFSLATATGNIDIAGRTVPTMRMNVLHRTETRQVTSNGWAAAHELLHIFGLADLYGDSHSERPERKDGTVLVASDFGIMGLSIYSYIAENDPTVRNRTRLSSDHFIIDHWLRFSEMLAWSRWQIGWLTKSQISCIEVPDALVTVDPVALGGNGTLMAAVPIDNRRVIVVEVRRSVEGDRRVPFASEGVLVYTVDSGLHSLPLKVAGDEDRTIDGYPLLQTGDSLSVLGHRVAVLAEQDGSYAVRIHEEP